MENRSLSVAGQSVSPDNLPQTNKQKGRVAECVFPGYVSCRGCSYSYRPDLYDGGCKLHYEANATKGGDC